jgi:hypothetical protein
MTIRSSLSNVRDAVLNEAKQTPLGTTSALITVSGFIAPLLSHGSGVHLPTSDPVQSFDIVTPSVLPLLKFAVYQIALTYCLHWLMFASSRVGVSFMVAAGVVLGISFAFLTQWDAFQLSLFFIQSEHTHYTVFEGIWIMAAIASGILFAVLQVERAIHMATIVEMLNLIFYTLFGLAIVVFLTSGTFNGFFENRLEPVWAAHLNSG